MSILELHGESELIEFLRSRKDIPARVFDVEKNRIDELCMEWRDKNSIFVGAEWAHDKYWGKK